MASFTISRLLWPAAAAMVAAIAYSIARMVRHRRAFRHLPGPPHSAFWGHLKIMGTYTNRMPPGTYIQAIMTQIKQDYDLPDIFYIDLWPFGESMIMLTGPGAAAIPTTVKPLDMPPVVADTIAPTLGASFIECTNGPLWKELHSQLAPGLTPASVRRSVRGIARTAKKLHDAFQTHALSGGGVMDLGYEMGKYPFEVLGDVFFGGPLSDKLYRDTVRYLEMMGEKSASPPSLNFIKKRRADREMQAQVALLDGEIEARIHARYAELQGGKVSANDGSKPTPMLDRMLSAQAQTGRPLDARTLKLSMENAKGFIAAGYGTTTDTSTYVWLLLNAFPETLKALREEHDRVFGKDLDKTLDMLEENPGLINKLDYTTAVINETLRLYPIGMVVRQPPADMTTIQCNGKTFPVPPNSIFSVVGHAMHYNPKIFEEPKLFKPERFIAKEGADLAHPRNAYRPFERGLRSCMGQTLAMDEMKIMLVLLARWFDMELVNHEPAAKPFLGHTDLDTKLGKHAFTVFKVTSTPKGPVQVKLTRAVRPE